MKGCPTRSVCGPGLYALALIGLVALTLASPLRGRGLAAVPRPDRSGTFDASVACRSSGASRGTCVWKTPVPGVGWSSPVVAGGRVWLTTAIDGPRRSSLRALAFDVETGREVVNVEVFRLRSAELAESQEQPRVADADRRRRSRLRPLRRRRHRGADDDRRDRVEDAAALRVAARQRRIARAATATC